MAQKPELFAHYTPGGQNLSFHPHVHCIVPAFGQKLSGKLVHIAKDGKYLYPVKMLSAVFKGKLMEMIARKLKAEKLFDQYKANIKSAWNKPWVVFCEPSLGKPDQLIKYLGQYVHRVAISNQRIVHLDDEKVTFQMKDYRDNAVNKFASLSGVEFLRRFCMHILPKRFVKIRYYGIYSSKISPALMNYAHKLIIKPTETVAERLKRLCNIDVHLCPACKKGRLTLVETYPRIRSPGFFSSYRIIL